jgi:type I restriction enzyme S subunit
MKPSDALPHPEDWNTAVIGDAVDIRRGVSWSKEQEHTTVHEGTVPVIGISNVQDRLELDELLWLAGLKPKTIEKKRVQKGWSVIVGSNGNRQRIGNAVFVEQDAEFLFASFLFAAKPKGSSGITAEFFYRWLRSEQVQSYLSASSEGSTGLSNLSHSFFRKMTIAFPEEGEQGTITRVLDAVDEAIDRARYVHSTAETLDHSLLHQLLEFGPIYSCDKVKPTHWKRKRVAEVADVGSGVTLGKDVTGFRHVKLPYLRVANVQDGHLDLSTVKTVKVRCDDVARYRLEPGDVLMTEGGDLDKLGRGTLWEGQIDNCLHQNHIFRVRADRTQLDPRYFSLVVESDISKRYFNRVAKKTTNLASTNKTQVRAFSFPLPPLKEQEQIAEVMSASKATLRSLERKVAALNELKKSLMHDLLTGGVRVNSALSQLEPVA